MNQREATDLLVRLYSRIAPDIEFDDIDPDADFREQAEIDSMDFLNFVVAVEKETGLEIPEVDYDHFNTLHNAAAYLADALSSRGN